jgi:hypothetical protein
VLPQAVRRRAPLAPGADEAGLHDGDDVGVLAQHRRELRSVRLDPRERGVGLAVGVRPEIGRRPENHREPGGPREAETRAQRGERLGGALVAVAELIEANVREDERVVRVLPPAPSRSCARRRPSARGRPWTRSPPSSRASSTPSAS